MAPDMPDTPDDALVRRVRSGDEAAFSALYDRHGVLVFSVALRICRTQADAEDAAQQAWVQAWSRARTYDLRRGPVAAWLLSIVRSRALDMRRRTAARDRLRSAAPEPASAPDPAESAERIQERDRVRSALRALDERERRVLEIAYFEGLSQSEIASRLEVPLGSVKSWTRRGLRRLRELLPEGSST